MHSVVCLPLLGRSAAMNNTPVLSIVEAVCLGLFFDMVVHYFARSGLDLVMLLTLL